MAQQTPRFVTKAKRTAWQPFVDSQVRRQIHRGVDQESAVEHALDLRDEHIRKGDKPPRYGRKN